jgi:hypothetical protein
MTATNAATKPETKAQAVPANAAKPVGADLGIDFDSDISEPDIECWHDPVETPVFVGQVVGHKVIEAKKKHTDVVLVKLLADTMAVVDKKTVLCKAGMVMGVFIRFKLYPLLELVEHKCTVRVTSLAKVEISGGNSMWNFKIEPKKGSKLGAPPRAAIRKAASSVDEGEVSDPDEF